MLLYLHIPFCDSKCHYCAFNSFTKNRHLKKAYIQSLLAQLNYELDRADVKKLDSIYIGGGTPSTIPARLYEPLFDRLRALIAPDTEITIEANPNSATMEWLRSIKALGVSRISFGVQSFDEKKLSFLGRSHTPKEAIRAVENAAKAGFGHINVDIIYDTAIDSKALLENDIKIASSLPIDHISAYALILEEGTPFENKKEYKKDDENLGYFIKELIPFPQYEVSNFGSYRSRHNIGYWRLEEYLGVGCGAVGFLQERRYYPPTDLHAYIQDPLEIREEPLSPDDMRFEKIFLGLRSCTGIDIDLLDEEKVKILLQEGKIVQKGSKIFNTNYFLADELALFLS